MPSLLLYALGNTINTGTADDACTHTHTQGNTINTGAADDACTHTHTHTHRAIQCTLTKLLHTMYAYSDTGKYHKQSYRTIYMTTHTHRAVP